MFAIKLGKTANFPFVTCGDDGIPVAPSVGPTAFMYENGNMIAMPTVPVVLTKTTGPGMFSAAVLLSNANDVEIGNFYEIWIAATVGGKTFVAPIANFIVTKFDSDDLASAINAWIAAGGPINANGTVKVGDPIEIVQGDDYSAATRFLSFNLVNGPELSFPAVPLYLGVGELRSSVPNYWITAAGAGVATRVDATTQRLDFIVPRSKTELQPAPKTLGYSIEARFGVNSDEWTIWRGEASSVKKFTV